MKKRLTYAFASATILIAVAACGHPAKGAPGTADQAENQRVYSLDYGDSFDTLSALEKGAVAEVVGVAEGSQVEPGTGPESAFPPYTVTDFSVERVLWGSLAVNSIPIRQPGDGIVSILDGGELLQKGQRYVMYVTPYEISRGEPNGQYSIVGDQGVWKQTGNAFDLVGRPSGLPKTVTAE